MYVGAGDVTVIRFRVYGFPVAQGRPKAFIPKGWTRPKVYDPAESKDWKRTVTAQALEYKPPTPLDGPLRVWLTFVMLRPKSIPAKKRPHPVVKPDVENLSKAICDAIRGVIYVDDSQIIELHLRKEYGEQPGVAIEVGGM